MEENLPAIDRFNLRVYGICIRNGHVLIVHENLNGFDFTKFPGGGLEYGEGLAEGLKREIKEELGLEAEILDHFYTCDFFQRSAFKSNEQLISIYYFIDIPNIPPLESFPVTNIQTMGHQLTFYWAELKILTTEDVTFPIDKLIIEKLTNT